MSSAVDFTRTGECIPCRDAVDWVDFLMCYLTWLGSHGVTLAKYNIYLKKNYTVNSGYTWYNARGGRNDEPNSGPWNHQLFFNFE